MTLGLSTASCRQANSTCPQRQSGCTSKRDAITGVLWLYSADSNVPQSGCAEDSAYYSIWLPNASFMSTLRECRLYGIIDLGYIKAGDCRRIAEQMVEGGVDLIQLRGKGKPIDELVHLTAQIHQITRRSGAPLIINDHAEVAARAPVEGVHVGQEDDSILVARQKGGRD